MKAAMPALFLAVALLPAYLEAQTFPTTPLADESAAVGGAAASRVFIRTRPG
jgi:hypothetical protein